MADQKFNSIQEIGFTGLINRFDAKLSHQRDDVVCGIGDDSSVVSAADNQLFCTTSEIFLKGYISI